jgi:hypothetical protein
MLKKHTLCIGVAPNAVSLLRVARWGRAAPEVLAEHGFAAGAAPADALAAALREVLTAQDVGGWPVSFVLADELTRLWQVTPPLLAARQADLEAAAALRFHALFGESPAAWDVSADWNADQPFFAAAMPRALKSTLEQIAAERSLAIVAMQPHFISVWNRWHKALKTNAWLGVMHSGVLTLGAVDGRQLRFVRALPVPHGADHYWLTQMVQREALLHDLQPPQLVQLAGPLPAALAKPPTHEGHIATAQLGAGQGEGWSAASLLACAGGAA